MSDEIVGIDLGTTNSEIAVYRDGRPEVLVDELGRTILPSVVGVGEAGDLLVGEEARNQFILYPERTVRSIKRRMGSGETVHLAGHEYTPQEISAIILKRLKDIAERRLGRSVRKAVITVPAYFSDTQRQATREAGEIAGLEVMRIVNEPTAAAMVYEATQHQGKRILVYDLGGGTFDASIVRIESGVVEVISSHGNNHLGGDDFDHKIVEHVLDHLKIKQGVDISDQPKAMARVLRSAEAAKKQLSDHPFARIEEEYLAESAGKPVHLSLELSREDYEDMIAPFIDETLGAVHIALESASLTSSQVDEILLVGGATRTPMVRRRLREVLRQRGPWRSKSGFVCRDGSFHPWCSHCRHRRVGRSGRRNPIYFRHQRLGRAQRRTLSLYLRSDHRQEHGDPGAQERSLLHRGRRPDLGRRADLPGREGRRDREHPTRRIPRRGIEQGSGRKSDHH